MHRFDIFIVYINTWIYVKVCIGFEIFIVDINTWIYVKVCIDLETVIVDIDTWIYVKIYIGLEISIIDINTWFYVKFAWVCFLVGPLSDFEMSFISIELLESTTLIAYFKRI